MGTREIPNQKIEGKEMSEGDMYRALVHNLKLCNALARGMAQSRKDLRWQHIAGLFEQIKTNCHIMMNLRKQMQAPPRIIQ